MDESTLISLLEKITNPENQQIVSVRQKYSHLPPETAESLMLHDLSGPVRELLSQQAEFSGNVMFRDGNSSASVLMFFPQRLIKRSISKSPQDAVEWLRKIVTTKEAEVLQIVPLWGPVVEVATSLLGRGLINAQP